MRRFYEREDLLQSKNCKALIDKIEAESDIDKLYDYIDYVYRCNAESLEQEILRNGYTKLGWSFVNEGKDSVKTEKKVDILLNAIIAIRNNATDQQLAKLTDNKMTKSNLYRICEDMEDSINQEAIDYDQVREVLEHLLITDEYWKNWGRENV